MMTLTAAGTLGFDVNDFLAPDFNVDRFVSECKDRMTMGNLREDLEAHYKSIQQALIELINQDYSDFLSLSSNLVGTDKTLNNLTRPLSHITEEVESVKREVTLSLKKIEEKLEQRKRIREKKSRLQHLMSVMHSLEKIEKILMQDPKSPDMEIFMSDERNTPGDFLERVAGEFNQLQFHVSQSKGHPMIESIRPRVSLITAKLQENLETTFQEGIQTKQPQLVMRCLRTYALIDKISYAEELFRHAIVTPFVERTINEESFSRFGLQGICDKVLKFLESDCSLVLELTTEDQQMDLLQDNKHEGVKGFDFLVNSIWPEIALGFEEKLPLVFSPGNPDIFIERYHIMMSFLERFEEFCTSVNNVKILRAHGSYQSFMTKWSLPVYYQIRFQEIAGSIEKAADNPLEALENAIYRTNIVESCWKGLNRCWHTQVFISSLIGRFWKLSLQIISRLGSFIKSVTERCKAGSSAESPSWKVEHLSLLLGDVFLFKKEVGDFFTSTVFRKIQDVSVRDMQIFKDAFAGSCQLLSECSNELAASIVGQLVEDASSQLDGVKNVPRLYRRTNKDPPSQASSYVAQAFLPIASLKNSSALDEKHRLAVVREVVMQTTSRFYAVVDELLTSIKKTEDSLMRLKRQRKGAVSQSLAAGEVTDESKIRRQIHLDVLEYGNQVKSVGVDVQSVTDLGRLKDVSILALQEESASF